MNPSPSCIPNPRTKPRRRAIGPAGACVALGLLATAAGAVEMPVVTVGNPGNAPESHIGAVAYTYQIGKYEVTTGQYAEFLNAVARTDAYGLYNVQMDTAVDAYGCNIVRGGTPGNYNYSVAPDWANRPVNFVSWGDAARFANWMHNGQPATGVQDATTTESGSYALNGAISDPLLWYVTREASATWVIPTRNEWAKAAYHKNDGPTGNYWWFPTQSDSIPGNVLGSPTDPGNRATFRTGTDGFTIGGPYWRTEVGEHENSASAYGTYDQGGNVSEWNEDAFATLTGPKRAIRGGSFTTSWVNMYGASGAESRRTTDESDYVGFRLALVPEPGSVLLTGIGIVLWAGRRRRPVANDE